MNEHAAPRRVFRSRSDRVVAGVAAGFARYLGLDPAVVRLVLVVLAFLGGLGILLYLAAWLVVPDEPAGTDPAGAPAVPARTGVGWTVVLVVVAVAVLAEVGRVGFGLRPGIVWPLALIGFGVALLWLRAGDGPAVATPAAPGAPPTPGAPGAPTSLPTSASTGAVPAALDPDAPSAPWAVAAVNPSPLRRAAPVLGRMALVLLAAAVALLVTAGAVLALEGPGAIDVTPVEALVTAVLVTLVAVAVGLGRRRLPDLVVVALPVLLVLALAAWIGPPMRGGFGSRNVRPADVRELDRTYHLAAGTLVLDLGGIDFGTGSRRVSASVAMGRLHVVVPDQVTVVVDAHVDAGEARVFGVRDTGTGVSRTTTDRAGRGTLHLRTDVGFGQVVVERASEQTTSLGARSARVAADVAA